MKKKHKKKHSKQVTTIEKELKYHGLVTWAFLIGGFCILSALVVTTKAFVNNW